MSLTNAERQKRFRERRNALARVGAEAPAPDLVEALHAEIATLTAEVERLRAEIARRDEKAKRFDARRTATKPEEPPARPGQIAWDF